MKQQVGDGMIGSDLNRWKKKSLIFFDWPLRKTVLKKKSVRLMPAAARVPTEHIWHPASCILHLASCCRCLLGSLPLVLCCRKQHRACNSPRTFVLTTKSSLSPWYWPSETCFATLTNPGFCLSCIQLGKGLSKLEFSPYILIIDMSLCFITFL